MTLGWTLICIFITVFVGGLCWVTGYSYGIEDRFGVADRCEQNRRARTPNLDSHV